MYNILVVDDDKEIVKAIEIYLGKENYKIYKAFDGEGALKQIKNNDIHLVILDIMMPNKNGLETLDEIRRDKNIPVIMLSAKSEDIGKINGLNCRSRRLCNKTIQSSRINSKSKCINKKIYSIWSNKRKRRNNKKR